MCVVQLVMQNSLFSTALTPIPAARSRRVQSVDRAASRYPRSSTPLRANAVNTSSRTSTQEPVVQNKSSSTGHIAGKPGRKRKLPAVGKGGKVANREVSTAAAVRNDRPTSSADSGHSRVIHSLAGKLQQQKCEVLFSQCAICCTCLFKAYVLLLCIRLRGLIFENLLAPCGLWVVRIDRSISWPDVVQGD